MIDVKHLLKEHAYRNIPLSYGEAYELGQYLLAGCRGDQLAQVQSVALLCALHNAATYRWIWNGNGSDPHLAGSSAAEQLAGICAAVFEQDLGKSEFGFLEPDISYAMDNCGMGGDLVVTANVSTLASFIAAAAEIPMCKHGSPANADQGRHGSSDFIRLCGINEYAPKRAVEECLARAHFAYTEALDTRYKHVHHQTHDFARLPHMNDIIGPVTNPLHPRILTRRVVGVNHLISPRVVAEAYQVLNKMGITHMRHLLVVRGFVDRDHEFGMDEVSICAGGTLVAELKDGEITHYRLDAECFGLKAAEPSLISPPSGMSKGEFSLALLERRLEGPALDMILANAALLFYLAGKSGDLKECTDLARGVYESGAPYRKMCEVRGLLPR